MQKNIHNIQNMHNNNIQKLHNQLAEHAQQLAQLADH